MQLPTRAGWSFVLWGVLDHLRRRCIPYALAGAAGIWCHHHYRLGVNVSASLPFSLFVVVLDERPEKVGDYIAFEWQRKGFYAPDLIFCKQIAGVAGQTISVLNDVVHIDGQPVAKAKRFSKKGVPLSPIAEGVIPQGYVFAVAPHPDSLDSRYSITGLVGGERVIGRGYVLF